MEPTWAVALANTLVASYVEQNLEAKLSISKDAGGWLTNQLNVQQQKMAESELGLQQYKEL